MDYRHTVEVGQKRLDHRICRESKDDSRLLSGLGDWEVLVPLSKLESKRAGSLREKEFMLDPDCVEGKG